MERQTADGWGSASVKATCRALARAFGILLSSRRLYERVDRHASPEHVPVRAIDLERLRPARRTVNQVGLPDFNKCWASPASFGRPALTSWKINA